MYVYNDSILKGRRRDLRKSQTEAEKILWDRLRSKKLGGFKFFRQYSVGPYILDFFCPAARLAIELDGKHHGDEETKDYDAERENYLRSHDIRTLRFWNREILQSLERILKKITDHIKALCTPS